ncbi:ABC transporter permease [Rhizobium vallis]|uniref:Autoinducer 2 import system permease protein LsrC n=1 Tax=Rhizobium vallis TaxID=634290 RepID=A0A3S0TBA3_9HYPH|nr:ABC transporter permease [Rhizobium vallis]RUM24432.1 ABC transporter permease [Rhizobium vallis]
MANNDAHAATTAADVRPETPGFLRLVLRNPSLKSLALVPVIIVVSTIGALINPAFLTSFNIFDNILAFSAALGLLVIAESILLIGGFIDLSLQSTIGFSVVLFCYLTGGGDSGGPGLGLSVAAAVPITLLVVVAIGVFNGFVVKVLKLNSFIVTLAMLILLQGLTLGISNGQTYTNVPDAVLYLGTGSVLGIPVQALIFIGAITAAALFMGYRPTGRAIYAMGGNQAAAHAAGIKTTRLAIGLFVFGSLMAMVAGVLLLSQVASAPPTLGRNMIFTVFAAAVLGGIDLNGGRGTIIGAALGVLLLSIIQNILILSSVPAFWIDAVYGAIIVAALIAGRLSSVKSLFGRGGRPA